MNTRFNRLMSSIREDNRRGDDTMFWSYAPGSVVATRWNSMKH